MFIQKPRDECKTPKFSRSTYRKKNSSSYKSLDSDKYLINTWYLIFWLASTLLCLKPLTTIWWYKPGSKTSVILNVEDKMSVYAATNMYKHSAFKDCTILMLSTMHLVQFIIQANKCAHARAHTHAYMYINNISYITSTPCFNGPASSLGSLVLHCGSIKICRTTYDI